MYILLDTFAVPISCRHRKALDPGFWHPIILKALCQTTGRKHQRLCGFFWFHAFEELDLTVSPNEVVFVRFFSMMTRFGEKL